MRCFNFGLVALFILCEINCLDAVRCLKCKEANTIDDCIQETECSPDEECFLEKKTTAALNIVINAGCKAKTVCDIVAGLIGRKRGTACFQCCNTTRCNGNLCRAGASTQDHCGNCPAIHDFKQCSRFSLCQSDQACYLRSYIAHGTVSHEVGCESKMNCKQQAEHYIGGVLGATEVSNGGKRTGEIEFCQACCTGDRCNIMYKDCKHMLNDMRPSNFTT